MKRVEINAVAFRHGDKWIAHCVEYDIVAHAKSLGSLWRALERTILANLRANAEFGRAGLDGIPPSPEMVREKFDRAETEFRFRGYAPRDDIAIKDLRLLEAA